ncbi:MAG: methylmalonyl-CoA epimerase [Bacteroidales bacterium OttesenSCG-928-I14]|jgi:methylmalonyl-CoA/ethylmalonyl-CoA epimerase|nr:methylmalonyl-CoA epimerase [Bacteroidales bacterium OttesenSCG-928-I14]
MNISRIEHIGIAVKSIENALFFYEKILGLDCYNVEEITDQGVKTAFFRIGDTKIELLEPSSEGSVIAKFIKKRGEGVHHIAFSVSNINDVLTEMKSKGVQLIDKMPRSGAEGLLIAFLHPKTTNNILIELCQ